MEHHVDRATPVGERVLINDGWYKTFTELRTADFRSQLNFIPQAGLSHLGDDGFCELVGPSRPLSFSSD